MAKATEPLTEKINKGSYEITSVRQGWFDTPSYKVTVRIVDRRTKRTVTMENETQRESAYSVRKRAIAAMEVKDDHIEGSDEVQ